MWIDKLASSYGRDGSPGRTLCFCSRPRQQIEQEDAVLSRDTALVGLISVAVLHLEHPEKETARAAKEHTEVSTAGCCTS